MTTHPFSTLSESFKNDMANFDWSWSTIWNWFLDTMSYQASQHGIIAYLVIGFIIAFILLHMDATKGFTTLIIATIYRQTIGTLFNGAALLIGLLGIHSKNIFVAKLKTLFRIIGSLLDNK